MVLSMRPVGKPVTPSPMERSMELLSMLISVDSDVSVFTSVVSMMSMLTSVVSVMSILRGRLLSGR